MSDKNKMDGLYSFDGKVNVIKALPFGLQHILAMFVANITPIILVAGACGMGSNESAVIIQSAMLIAGIGTLIQLFPIWRIGSGLPIVMGISFTFVSIACVVGAKYGYGAVLGAVLIGGIIEFLLGLTAKYWIRIVSPIVSASVVTAIGFSLLKVGVESFGGGVGAQDFGSVKNWIVASVTLLSCALITRFAKGYLKQLSVLIGLIVGYILALALGMVDFSGLDGVSIFSLPKVLPVSFEFRPDAIIAFILIFLVSATETIGDTSAIATSGLGRTVKEKETSGSIACDGIVSSLSSLIGCMPITSFSQNVGLVVMTKVVNRIAIASGAVIMIIAGFFPVFGALITTLPNSVLGGCTMIMFANIIVSGLEMSRRCGLTPRNLAVLAFSLSFGVGFTQVPGMFDIFPDIVKTVFAENCVAIVFVIAIILDRVLPVER